MTRRRSIPVLLLSLFALACGGDDDERPAGQRTGAQADSAGMMGMPGEPMVTPEESASAARDVQAHADSIRDAIQRASGAAAEDIPKPPPALSRRERYEQCMAQARAGDGEVRARLEQVCDNIRNQPDR